jgi:hypothetical protein
LGIFLNPSRRMGICPLYIIGPCQHIALTFGCLQQATKKKQQKYMYGPYIEQICMAMGIKAEVDTYSFIFEHFSVESALPFVG